VLLRSGAVGETPPKPPLPPARSRPPRRPAQGRSRLTFLLLSLFALRYFTGDAHFNRSLRAFCKRAGLTLSDGGLSLCGRRNGSRRWVGRSVACDEEGDVFDALGIGHVRPEFRDGRKGAGAGGGEEQRGYWDDGLVDVDEESGYAEVDSEGEGAAKL
jgi:hypothetical protein